MRSWVHASLLIGIASVSAVTRAADPPLATDEDKTLYALGMLMSGSLEPFALTPAEFAIVQSGLAAGSLGKPSAVDLAVYGPKVQELLTQRMAVASAAAGAAGAAFLDKVASEKGAVRTPSGLVIKTIRPGTGATPTPTDEVKVHYHGTLTDGTVFDSSVQRGQAATFPLANVIPCWTEALQLMKVGGKSLVVCPASLAYGERGSPPVIGGNSTLIFEVELLGIVKPAT